MTYFILALAFDIFFSNQGSQGQLGKASKQQLSTVFGTSNEDEAVKKLLELGTAKPGEAIHKGFTGNDSRYDIPRIFFEVEALNTFYAQGWRGY